MIVFDVNLLNFDLKEVIRKGIEVIVFMLVIEIVL